MMASQSLFDSHFADESIYSTNYMAKHLSKVQEKIDAIRPFKTRARNV